MQARRLHPPLLPCRRLIHAWCRAGCRTQRGGRHATTRVPPLVLRLRLCPGLVLPKVYLDADLEYIDAVVERPSVQQ